MLSCLSLSELFSNLKNTIKTSVSHAGYFQCLIDFTALRFYVFCQGLIPVDCHELAKYSKFYLARAEYWVQFSRSVVSDSLRPHESQHARPPCPSEYWVLYFYLNVKLHKGHLLKPRYGWDENTCF